MDTNTRKKSAHRYIYIFIFKHYKLLLFGGQTFFIYPNNNDNISNNDIMVKF